MSEFLGQRIPPPIHRSPITAIAGHEAGGAALPHGDRGVRGVEGDPRRRGPPRGRGPSGGGGAVRVGDFRGSWERMGHVGDCEKWCLDSSPQDFLDIYF